MESTICKTKIIHEKKINQHTQKSSENKRRTNTQKVIQEKNMNQNTQKRFMKKFNQRKIIDALFEKYLKKVNVPNQHVIFREIVENQHVSHVFIDHLYPSKYDIVS
eukprot:UN16853